MGVVFSRESAPDELLFPRFAGEGRDSPTTLTVLGKRQKLALCVPARKFLSLSTKISSAPPRSSILPLQVKMCQGNSLPGLWRAPTGPIRALDGLKVL